METNKNGMQDQDENANHQNRYDHRDGTEETNSGINKDVSGNDRYEEGKEARRHHEEHGIKRYKMYQNHSSADDQPRTNSGPDL